MAEKRPEWGAWVRQVMDGPPRLRAVDISRRSGHKAGTDRPVIGEDRISEWRKGERPKYELALAFARATGRDDAEALVAAGYELPRLKPTDLPGGATVSGPVSERSLQVLQQDEDDAVTWDDLEDRLRAAADEIEFARNILGELRGDAKS